MPTTTAGLATEEGISSAMQEVACRKCRRFLGEVAVETKAVMRLRCHCGTDNLLIVGQNRITVVQGAGEPTK